jgi:hypothetical protein
MTAPACRPAHDVALAEYAQIKAEQVARIGFRDNLIYATLITIGGTVGFAHSAARTWLLLVPAAAFVLGWTYLANDHMITAIGRYFREHPTLPGLGWETDHPADKRHASRKAMQLAVDLATFCGSGLAALVIFWSAPGTSVLPVIVSAAEAVAVAVLAAQFTAYADVPAPRRWLARRAGGAR